MTFTDWLRARIAAPPTVRPTVPKPASHADTFAAVEPTERRVPPATTPALAAPVTLLARSPAHCGCWPRYSRCYCGEGNR